LFERYGFERYGAAIAWEQIAAETERANKSDFAVRIIDKMFGVWIE